MSSINTVQQDLQSDEALQHKINAARIAVNVITICTVSIAVFMGVMLGVFNAAEPAEGVSENMNFLMGFSAIFFTIAIPSLLFNFLVKRSIADKNLWKQALVWVFCIFLCPMFPMGTAAAIVIVYAQVSWMRAAKTI